MQSRWNERIVSLKKLVSQALNWKKGALFFYINSDKLETTLTPTLDYTRLYYTSFIETFNIPVVMSWLWILLSVVSQLVVISGSRFMKHTSPALIRTEPRGHAGKRNLTKLVAIKTCQPYLLQMTCCADRSQLFFATALGNASEFSYHWTNSSYTG